VQSIPVNNCQNNWNFLSVKSIITFLIALKFKRLNEYRNLYINLGNLSTTKKVAKLSGTRWLARESAISTILQQWDEPFLFFTKAKVEDKCFSTEQIIHIMERPAYKVYLVFLKYNLEKTS
jgi:hypothetical protein